MKTKVTLCLLLLGLSVPAFAQTAPEKGKTYQAWIRTFDDPAVAFTGNLYDALDSSVVLSNPATRQRGAGPGRGPGMGFPGMPGMKRNDMETGENNQKAMVKAAKQTFDVKSIEVIKVRQKGSVGKGILFGAIGGLVTGAAIDLLLYTTAWKRHDNENDSFQEGLDKMSNNMQYIGSAILIGIGSIGAGIGIGAAIGSPKITIPINGSPDVYNEQKEILKGFSEKYQFDLGNKSFTRLGATVTDIDGNVYRMLALGGQVWMAENLRTKHFRDGSEIANIKENKNPNEKLYEWSEVSGNAGVCPTGWHIPGKQEWESMCNSLGGSVVAGEKLSRDFSTADQPLQWWTGTEKDSVQSYCFYLDPGSESIIFMELKKSTQLPLRCLRD